MLSLMVVCMALGGVTMTAKEKKSPQQQTYNYLRAQEAFEADNYEEALEWLNRELSGDPKNGYAFELMSPIYLSYKDYAGALETSDKALKFLPKKEKNLRSFIHYVKALAHLELRDTLSAFNDYEMSIKENPDDEDPYIQLAQLYSNRGEYDKSDSVLERMGKRGVGKRYELGGKGLNAKARGDYDTALRYLNEALLKYPDYSNASAMRGEIYMQQGKWTEAVNDYVEAMRNDPPDSMLHLIGNMDQQALPVFAAKIKVEMVKNSSDSNWPALCAIAYYGNDDYAEAIEWYKKVVDIQPFAAAYSAIADCYRNLDEYDTALEYIDKAIALDDEDANLLLTKARVLDSMRDYEQALTVCDSIVAMAPESIYAYNARASVNMNMKRWRQAAEDYEAVTVLVDDINTINPHLLGALADALKLDGQKERAEYYYKKLMELEGKAPLDEESYTPLALASLGLREEALKAGEVFLADTTPVKIPYNLYQMACLYSRLGDKEMALDFLKQAIEAGYDNYDNILIDYDLDLLRDMPEFNELLEEHVQEVTEINIVEIVDKDDIKTTVTPVSEEMENSVPVRKTEVPFKRENGVTKVECTINGLPLHFVFDTGAGDVTISMVEANFMLKNGYLKRSDIKGSARYIDANGDISEGTVINLRKIDFGGMELDNVRASVVRNQQAPLLLGQSVLSRLGKIEIDNRASRLIITNVNSK